MSTVTQLNKRVERILSKEEKTLSYLSEEEKINELLDNINYFKKFLNKRTEKLNELDEAFSTLTWFDVFSTDEEKKIESLIGRGLNLHKTSLLHYVALRKSFVNLNANKKELKNFKMALDNFEDTLFEVKDILFGVRKDPEFMSLLSKVG